MKILKVLIIFLVAGTAAWAEEPGFISINAAPRYTIPLGESSDYFNPGFGGGLAVDYKPDFIPLLFARLQLDYDYIPIVTQDGFSMLCASAGPGVVYSPVENISFAAWGTAGYFFGSISDGSGTPGGNLSLSAGASVSYAVTPAISIDLSGSYTAKLNLLNGVGVTLGTVIHPEGFGSASPDYGNNLDLLESLTPGISGSGVDVKNISFNRIFPVLFKYYDENPVADAVLYNNENKPVTDLSLSFFVERYMDNPKQGPVIGEVAPGESAGFDVYALFSDNVLDITEGTKVSANIILKYTYKKKEVLRKYTVSMDIYDRNAITWDDDRKAAAFVTAKDPSVLETAKNIAGWVKENSPAVIDKNLCTAMGIHNGLKNAGINYQVDPKTPFAEFSADSLSVDFLQFPRQTLAYTSGDCDDLSILYSALLESVGIETAFITVPGHIFMAFALNMEPLEAKRTFLKPEDLIITDEKVWVPVEITLVQDSFLTAWTEGAKEWREYADAGKSMIYPMHDSWKLYAPAGLPGSTEVSMPDKAVVTAAFSKELKTFIDRELYPKVERFNTQISRSGGAAKYINRLGVLYAKYGLNDKAEAEFSKILKKEEYVPTLINMGNLKYLQQDVKASLEYYERAEFMEPENSTVLVALARANHELENYEKVKDSYGLLKIVDPELAEEFAYLELRGNEASRASNAATQKEIVLWNEN